MSRMSLALALLLAAACGSAAHEMEATALGPPVPARETLAMRVQEALLATPGFEARAIEVHVEGQTVHLGGQVPSAHHIADARRIAESVPGVTHVLTRELRVG